MQKKRIILIIIILILITGGTILFTKIKIAKKDPVSESLKEITAEEILHNLAVPSGENQEVLREITDNLSIPQQNEIQPEEILNNLTAPK